MGLWNESMKNQIIAASGSIQGLSELTPEFKKLYRTIWEIPQKALLEMAADRAPFIDQSQSLNVFMSDPTSSKMTSMHFFAWKQGLKTGMYYLRSRPAVDAIKFTVDQQALVESLKKQALVAKAVKQQTVINTSTNGGSVNGLTTPELESPKLDEADQRALDAIMCSLENKDACVMCSG
jgi:ribonucleoside-diphosphate reductase subunit M1